MERVSDAGKRVWLRTQRSHVRHVRGARFLAGREQNLGAKLQKKTRETTTITLKGNIGIEHLK